MLLIKSRNRIIFFSIFISFLLLTSFIFLNQIKIIGMPGWTYATFIVLYFVSWILFYTSSSKFRAELIDLYPFFATISGLAMPGFFAAGTKNDIPGPNQLLDHMVISASSISMWIVLVAMPVIVFIFSFSAAYQSKFPADPPS